MKTNPLRYRDLKSLEAVTDKAYNTLQWRHKALYGISSNGGGLCCILSFLFCAAVYIVPQTLFLFMEVRKPDLPFITSIWLPIFLFLGLTLVIAYYDEVIFAKKLELFVKKHSKSLTAEEKDFVFDFLRSAASGVDEILVPAHLLQSLKDKNVIFETNLYESKEISTFMQLWAINHYSRQRRKEEKENKRLQKAMTKNPQ